MSKYKIRNAHCTYYEGQTGLCKAKEFVKCNPVNCKLYTINKLSTVVDLQEQLKRKEQECEELKIMLKDLSYENQKFCYQIEEQTKQLEPFKDKYFKGLDNVVIAELAKKSIRITVENSKLEQTISEIKEIVKNMNNECFYSDFDCKNCDMKNGCTYFNKKQILQKISECGVGND